MQKLIGYLALWAVLAVTLLSAALLKPLPNLSQPISHHLFNHAVLYYPRDSVFEVMFHDTLVFRRKLVGQYHQICNCDIDNDNNWDLVIRYLQPDNYNVSTLLFLANKPTTAMPLEMNYLWLTEDSCYSSLQLLNSNYSNIQVYNRNKMSAVVAEYTLNRKIDPMPGYFFENTNFIFSCRPAKGIDWSEYQSNNSYKWVVNNHQNNIELELVDLLDEEREFDQWYADPTFNSDHVYE